MKKYLHIYILLGMLLLAGVLYIHSYVTFVLPPPSLTSGEKKMTDALFTETKTQCAGRYLFEVPVSFANTLHEGTKIGDARITSKRLYPPAFKQRIRLREEELKKEHTVDSIDQPFLKQIYRLNDNAVIFDRNENESVPGFGRILEGHIYSDGVAFAIKIEITDFSDDRYKKEREFFLRDEIGRAPTAANTKPQKLAEMQDLLLRLSGRKDDEIPTQPGTCIPDGFIRDGRGQPKEKISFIYPYNDNFLFSVSTNNYLQEPTSMLERTNDIQGMINATSGRSLRKGKVSLNGIEADEWLIVAPAEKNKDIRSGQLLFNLMANEKTVEYKRPILDLTLNNHALPPPTYSDAQLLEIWDRISRTFRLRPGAY